MIDFFKKLFGHSGSSSTAKERLRLVLMTDHLELAPDMVEAMKRDLVDVISRYVEVDRDKIDVTFEQQDKALAMLANIPILVGQPLDQRPSGTGHRVRPSRPRRYPEARGRRDFRHLMPSCETPYRQPPRIRSSAGGAAAIEGDAAAQAHGGRASARNRARLA